MKILVTGAAGFIGSNFTRHIINKYPLYKVIGLDLLTYAGHLSSITDLLQISNFTFIKGDINDKKLLNSLFINYKIDVIINFAAESHVDRSIDTPDIFLKTNIIGTHVLLETAKKFGVNRFHQVSTDEVYGDLPIDKPELLFIESSPIKTSSPYSASKASADLLVQAYFRTFNLPITISRCSNNYGPYQFPEKLVPMVINNALTNKSIPIYGKGINIRDWLHVHDHCIALDLIIHKGIPGEIYNIGGNNEFKNIDIVKLILKTLNKPNSLIKFVADRKGHDLRYAINSDKLKSELNWKPDYSFESGIEQTIKWYLDNITWVESILKSQL